MSKTTTKAPRHEQGTRLQARTEPVARTQKGADAEAFRAVIYAGICVDCGATAPPLTPCGECGQMHVAGWGYRSESRTYEYCVLLDQGAHGPEPFPVPVCESGYVCAACRDLYGGSVVPPESMPVARYFAHLDKPLHRRRRAEYERREREQHEAIKREERRERERVETIKRAQAERRAAGVPEDDLPF